MELTFYPKSALLFILPILISVRHTGSNTTLHPVTQARDSGFVLSHHSFILSANKFYWSYLSDIC